MAFSESKVLTEVFRQSSPVHAQVIFAFYISQRPYLPTLSYVSLKSFSWPKSWYLVHDHSDMVIHVLRDVAQEACC